MAKYWDMAQNYAQPTLEELKQRSNEAKEREKSKGKELHPVIIQGRNIVKNWWGVAWCKNLERYADYASRIDRGKRYVRTGAVIDLQIEQGRILAKVQGTQKTPYKTEISISPLSKERCQQIIDRCGRKLENVEELLAGKFPTEMEELFCGKDGLFPTPKEISFTCSCPDWAVMCKHVAAVLYGVGARLDNDPMLFFHLRGIDVERFIDVTLANKVEAMLANMDRPSSRIIEGDVSELFGV